MTIDRLSLKRRLALEIIRRKRISQVKQHQLRTLFWTRWLN